MQNPTQMKTKSSQQVQTPSSDAVEFIVSKPKKQKPNTIIVGEKPSVIVVDKASSQVRLPAPKEVLKNLNFDIEKVERLTGGVDGVKIKDPIKVAYEKMLEVVSKTYTGNVRVLSDQEMIKYNMPGYKVVFLNLENYKGKYIFMLVNSRRGLWFLIIKPEVYGESLKQWLKDYFNS